MFAKSVGPREVPEACTELSIISLGVLRACVKLDENVYLFKFILFLTTKLCILKQQAWYKVYQENCTNSYAEEYKRESGKQD